MKEAKREKQRIIKSGNEEQMHEFLCFNSSLFGFH